MLAGAGSSFDWTYSNHTTATPSAGTSVIPGASNAEGAWTQVATSANIAQDVCWIRVWVSNGATSTAQKDHLLDIGVDPAGGSSYTAVISNIICGQSAAPSAGGRWYAFPYYIKAGSSVAVRIQGQNATAGTAFVAVKFYGQPSNPHMVRVGQVAETIGAISNSGGVSFTPGNTNAEGAWVSLGTTTNKLWWWQLCVQISNGTTTSLGYAIDLAYGDSTNKVMIIENLWMGLPGTAEVVLSSTLNHFMECYREVPAGSEIFVRGTCSSTTLTGWNAVAIGVG